MSPLDIHDVARPRQLTRHGVRDVKGMRVKVYGIASETLEISPELLEEAWETFEANAPGISSIASLGFGVVHPGSEGVSFLLHWWEQGSVLCHRVTRRVYDGTPVDVAARGVIGCVWELAVIHAEQRIWRETMMTPDGPNPKAYLARWHEADHV